ncbi:hypothetical protein PG991_001526 [Apiospora marii]|uniref:Apple domain-containing protein n=1 Tax=Apiospora marii TaxID=335849 RepID=A0ABR1SPX6_9PEZI
MKTVIIAAALAAVARAQDIDWDAWDSEPKPTPASAPVGGGSEVVPYDGKAAAASAAADITSDLVQAGPQRRRRGIIADNDSIHVNIKRSPCQTQPAGAGPVPSPDTASAFLSYAGFAAQASAAPVPSGYNLAFSNLAASSSAYGYMGYTTLQTYDTALCASKCNAITGCSAINIYFERDPTVEPADTCQDPASTTNIKCVFWGGPVSKDNTKNAGQWRNKFQVVMAGSNGYVSKSIAPQPGYNGPTYLGNAAINAPLDCSGADTYIQPKVFTGGPFDAGLCAAACSAQSAYNLAHPPSDGSKPKTCQFFNTYMLLKNGVPEGQYCSLYTMAWDNSYAKNTGQYRGSDRYTIAYSYTFVNGTDPGKPAIPCNVASASSAIKSASLQPYCSSLLGYTTPVVTATASTTVTVAAGTSTSNVVPLATSVVTSTQLVAVTQVRKRDLPAAAAPTKRCTDDHSLTRRDDAPPLTPNAKNEDGSFVDVIMAPDVVSEPAEGAVTATATATPAGNSTTSTPALARRDAVPSPLANLAADVVSSACSLVATPVTTTSTALTTQTGTVTSGFVQVTITAATSTVLSTTVVTSTTTIMVAASAPTGTIGYLKLNPPANPGAAYALSDSATHMTDNTYFPNLRETFIVTADGYLYSVTNNAYYYLQGTPSLLWWSNTKSRGQAWFDSRRNADGTLTVLLKKDGNAANGYLSFCTKQSRTGDGNSGSGLHVYAVPQPGYYSDCADMQLYIDPVS